MVLSPLHKWAKGTCQNKTGYLKKRKHHTSKVPVPTLIFTCLVSLMSSDWALTTALVVITAFRNSLPHSSSVRQDLAKKKKFIKPSLISFCGFLISWKAVQHLQNTFPKEITVQAKFKYLIIDCMCFILSSFHYNALSTIADRFFQSSSGSPKWLC